MEDPNCCNNVNPDLLSCPFTEFSVLLLDYDYRIENCSNEAVKYFSQQEFLFFFDY